MSVRHYLTRHVHPGQALLRSLVLLGAAVAVGGAAVVGSVPTWLEVGTALLAVVAVARPDSLAGLGLFALIGQLWLSQPAGSVTSPWLLIAAAGVVASHVGLLVASQGPASMGPDPIQLRLWAWRGAGLWLSACLVWLAARLVQDTRAPSAALVGALVVLLVATVWSAIVLMAKRSAS